MALKSPQQFIDSLRDDRVVYCQGERVEDVTTHPHLKACVRAMVIDYVFAQDPQYKELFVDRNEEGEEVSFVFIPPKSVADLQRRRKIIQTLGHICHGAPGGAKLTGIDGLNGLAVVCRRVDAQMGTNYAERFEAYRDYLQKTDSAVALAMTDVKGDRSLRPSRQEKHKDHYLRIVDQSSDGIVVRGAKMHISFAPCANEMIVLPGRFMREEDKDYAVAFALQPNAKGITMVAASREHGEDGNYFDFPQSAVGYPADALVVFDDVFVPNERVFLKGEWPFSGHMAYMFANFHRLTADTYKYLELEILVGVAALLAEYNGVERASHIRDKLTWLVTYAETTEGLARAACEACVSEPDSDLVYPNPLYSNLAKVHFADNYHQAVKHLQDIGGGILATVPHSKDFLSPETGPILEKYLGGKASIPTEHRLRMIKLANELASPYHLIATLHAEGSLAAQRLSIYQVADFERFKAAARRACWLSDGSEHPTFSGLAQWEPTAII